MEWVSVMDATPRVHEQQVLIKEGTYCAPNCRCSYTIKQPYYYHARRRFWRMYNNAVVDFKPVMQRALKAVYARMEREMIYGPTKTY